MNRRRFQLGFSMVELMATLSVVALLAGLSLPGLGRARHAGGHQVRQDPFTFRLGIRSDRAVHAIQVNTRPGTRFHHGADQGAPAAREFF